MKSQGLLLRKPEAVLSTSPFGGHISRVPLESKVFLSRFDYDLLEV